MNCGCHVSGRVGVLVSLSIFVDAQPIFVLVHTKNFLLHYRNVTKVHNPFSKIYRVSGIYSVHKMGQSNMLFLIYFASSLVHSLLWCIIYCNGFIKSIRHKDRCDFISESIRHKG